MQPKKGNNLHRTRLTRPQPSSPTTDLTNAAVDCHPAPHYSGPDTHAFLGNTHHCISQAPTLCSSDQACDLVRNHASSDRIGDQACNQMCAHTTSDQAPDHQACDQACAPARDHACCDNIRDQIAQPHDATSTDVVTGASTSTPYINLVALACSATTQQFKDSHGLDASVYTAHLTHPFEPGPPEPMSPYADHFLSYDFLADAAISIPTPLPENNNADTVTQSQMLRAEDRDRFVACQVDEINTLTDMDIMDVLPIERLPPRAKLLSSIWGYWRKRLPNGLLTKYKSRLCVNGKDQAFGRDFWETYAPVAAWPTIRLLLHLSTIFNLHTRQVDYTSAFPQADLDVPVFMHVPQGWIVSSDGTQIQHSDPKFNNTTHYLFLKNKLYGCKQAA
jgi:hypothetical protein